MNHPEYEQYLHQTTLITKLTEPSIDNDARQKTLVSEPREMSGNDVLSVVIVNDIDVEEEISRAQNEKMNYFKVLSMSFYGNAKGKSRSMEHQDSQDSQKLSVTYQSGGKPMIPRKTSAHTSSDNKKKSTKMAPFKPKVQEPAAKKSTLPIKQLQLAPEQLRKRVMSPAAESIKVYSPIMAGKKYQIGNFIGNLLPNKEAANSREYQQRSQISKKGQIEGDGDNSSSNSPTVKISQTKRSNSPNTASKKSTLFKLNRKPQKGENVNQKTQIIDAEPSTIDLRDETCRDKEINVSQEKILTKTSLGGGVNGSQPNSRKNSAKAKKEKSSGTPNNSGRSLPSTANSQAKISLRETLESKGGYFEQEMKMTTLMDDSPPVRKENIRGEVKKTTTQGKVYKTHSQEAKPMMEEDSSFGKIEVQRSKQVVKKEMKKPEDRQKSPLQGKRVEKGPVLGAGGVSGFDLKKGIMETLAMKQTEKSKNESPEPKGKIDVNSPMKAGSKSKTNSVEKMKKIDLYTQSKTMKKAEGNDQTPKMEVTKAKNVQNGKPFEGYSSKAKDALKNRPKSPAPENTRGSFDLWDKLLSQQKLNAKPKV